MMTARLLVAAFVLLAWTIPARAEGDPVAEVNEVLARSLVKIVASQCNRGVCASEPISSTGFFVELNDTLFIATTLHGVAFYSKITWSTDTIPERATSIKLVNAQSDVALLAVTDAERLLEQGVSPLQLRPIKDEELASLANEDVTVLGYKLGLRVPTAETGKVRITGPHDFSEMLAADGETLDPHVDRFVDLGTKIIQLQNRLDPGDSGAPVLMDGFVVAMAHGGLKDSSVNWAIPAEAIALADATDSEAFAPQRAAIALQSLTIRLFNVSNDPKPAHAVTLPLRYTMVLRLSAQTELLAGYLSRLRGYSTFDAEGQNWAVGEGPLQSGEIDYLAPGVDAQIDGNTDAATRPTEVEQAAEEAFLKALVGSALQVQCTSDQRLAQEDEPFWPLDRPTLSLRHYFTTDELRFARETYRDRRDLYVYLDALAEISPFGRSDRFALEPTEGADQVTDQELDKALCHAEFVTAQTADVSKLNSALAAGAACVVLLLPDGMSLQLVLTGQSFEPDLAQPGLLGTLFLGPMPNSTARWEGLCGEKLY